MLARAVALAAFLSSTAVVPAHAVIAIPKSLLVGSLSQDDVHAEPQAETQVDTGSGNTDQPSAPSTAQ